MLDAHRNQDRAWLGLGVQCLAHPSQRRLERRVTIAVHGGARASKNGNALRYVVKRLASFVVRGPATLQP